MPNPPRIFFVNWFRKDRSGRFLWPGFSENLRVLIWILKRARGMVGAIKTPLGYIPRYEDIDMSGLNFNKNKWNKLFEIKKKCWMEEADAQKKFLDKFGQKLPKEFILEEKAFRDRLKKYK